MTTQPTSVRGDTVSRDLLGDPRFVRNAELLRRSTERLGDVRVLSGVAVKPTDFLDCVAVGGDEWGCTGTLIGPRTVLTACHCRASATRVFFGNDIAKGGRVVSALPIPHPGYDQSSGANDLMVLLLESPVEDVVPRGFAPGALVDAATDGRVVGFGTIDTQGRIGYGQKRMVDLPIASPACAGQVAGRPDAVVYGCQVERELVAGRPQLLVDSCRGDSGGPFYIRDGNGQWMLAAATSRATRSATHTCGDGGVYVRVDAYRDWIQSVTIDVLS